MKILLVNMPWNINGRKGVRAGSRWPHLKIPEEENYMPYPFFLGYATSLLKKNNIETKGIDAIAEDISSSEFLKKVQKYNPDLLFAEISIPSMANDLRQLKLIKEIIKCKIAIAGPDITFFNESFLQDNKFLDFTLVGEYEFNLLKLVQHLLSNKKLDNISGITFRKKSKIIKNPPSIEKISLDKFPWPDRIDYPLYRYHDCPGNIPSPCAQIISSRGCPFECIFCAWPQLVYGSRNYRCRNIKDVVDEMEFLVYKKGFKSIYFDDDTFNVEKKRMFIFAEELKKRKWKTPWAFMGRADLVDAEILSRFRECGLTAVKYGVESGVQELVNNANKKLNLEIATRNMLITKRFGIKMHLTFAFGLPGETKETIDRTINYAINLDPESVQFSIITPFPGTKLYSKLKSDGKIMSDNFEEYDGNSRSVIRTDQLSPTDLTNAQKTAYLKWKEHVKLRNRYFNNSPYKLFLTCYKEHNLIYALKHAYSYVRYKKYKLCKNE